MPFLSSRGQSARGFFGGGTVPGPPTNLSSIEGNQQLTVYFTAPSFNGGLDITNYQYALSTNDGASYGSWTSLSPADIVSPITIGGLTNGQQYYVKLRAVNVLGGGLESDPLSTNTNPFTLPGAPTISVARQASQTLRITLSTAAAANGRTVTSYQYRIKNTGGEYGSYISLSGTTGPWDIGSLANGTSYTVQVRGVNVGGGGAGSNEPSATPFTTPDQVGTPSSSSGDRRFTINWTAPGTGGNTITAYRAQYSTDGGASWTGDATPTTSSTSHTFTVANGSSYIGRVQAINAAGNGTYSAASTARTPTFAAPGVLVDNLPGYGNKHDSTTWYRRPIRVTFSPTACENYRDTYVYVTVSGGDQQIFGPYTSSSANQTLDVYTYTATYYGIQNIGLNQSIYVTVTTFNTEGHGVSVNLSPTHNTGGGNYWPEFINDTWDTDYITVTGGSMTRKYYNWYSTPTESVRSAVVYARVSQSSPVINTITSGRNPSVGLSSASSSTGTGGGSSTFLALNDGNSWGTGNNVWRSHTWNHADQNVNIENESLGWPVGINNTNRYSVIGGGTITGDWAAGQQPETYVRVSYRYRVERYI
jgi:hypothetical protein